MPRGRLLALSRGHAVAYAARPAVRGNALGFKVVIEMMVLLGKPCTNAPWKTMHNYQPKSPMLFVTKLHI